MRDTDRIDRILTLLRVIWLRFPDWRLGQLLVNAVPEIESSLFYIEDAITEEKLDTFEGEVRCLQGMFYAGSCGTVITTILDTTLEKVLNETAE